MAATASAPLVAHTAPDTGLDRRVYGKQARHEYEMSEFKFSSFYILNSNCRKDTLVLK